MTPVMDNIRFMGYSARMMQGITDAINGSNPDKALYLLSGLYTSAYRYYIHGSINRTAYNRTYRFYTDMMRQLL